MSVECVVIVHALRMVLRRELADSGVERLDQRADSAESLPKNWGFVEGRGRGVAALNNIVVDRGDTDTGRLACSQLVDLGENAVEMRAIFSQNPAAARDVVTLVADVGGRKPREIVVADRDGDQVG